MRTKQAKVTIRIAETDKAAAQERATKEGHRSLTACVTRMTEEYARGRDNKAIAQSFEKRNIELARELALAKEQARVDVQRLSDAHRIELMKKGMDIEVLQVSLESEQAVSSRRKWWVLGLGATSIVLAAVSVLLALQERPAPKPVPCKEEWNSPGLVPSELQPVRAIVDVYRENGSWKSMDDGRELTVRNWKHADQ